MKIFGHGILGMNARNLKYIRQKNSAESISLADSKMKTKRFLGDRGIPFATTYAVLKTAQEIASFDLGSIPEKGFVIKPNHGSQGNGIVIVRREGDEYMVQGEAWSEDDFRLHMTDILHGSFSIQGSHDSVIIEELLMPGKDFAPYCQHGLADIRVIVVNLVPVTAMVRMPTSVSGGKANLAQGGAGLGLNIATGTIATLMQYKKVYTTQFPQEHVALANRVIPFWDDILLLSSQVQLYTKLGYLALDWVITEKGPKLLEINARAGLEIQNVNLIPLASRLKKVEDLKVVTPEKGVEIAKALFSSGTTSPHSGRKIIPFEQSAFIEGKSVIVVANPKSQRTSISEDVLPYGKVGEPIVVECESGLQIPVAKYVVQKHAKQAVELGRDVLANFLVDPSICVQKSLKRHSIWSDALLNLDESVHALGKKLNISVMLKPVNIAQCLEEFLSQPETYNPQFEYNFPSWQQIEFLRDELEMLSKLCTDSQGKVLPEEGFLLPIYETKIDELRTKLELIDAYKSQNGEKIQKFSDKLFGPEDSELLTLAEEKIDPKNRLLSSKSVHLGRVLSLDEVVAAIDQYFLLHDIKQVSVTLSDEAGARMSVSYGKKIQIRISQQSEIYEKEVEAILAHELGTHLARYLQGKRSGLRLFQSGTGYYISDEEGLAVHNSLRSLPESYEKAAMYEKYVLVSFASTHSFSDVVARIREMYPDRPLASVFTGAMRLKQGIEDTAAVGMPGYGKGRIYLAGLVRVEKWLQDGGNIGKLACGKIRIQDIASLEMLGANFPKSLDWLGAAYQPNNQLKLGA